MMQISTYVMLMNCIGVSTRATRCIPLDLFLRFHKEIVTHIEPVC